MSSHKQVRMSVYRTILGWVVCGETGPIPSTFRIHPDEIQVVANQTEKRTRRPVAIAPASLEVGSYVFEKKDKAK